MIDADEDLTFKAARALVDAGEYLDCIPGVPSTVTDGDELLRRDASGRLHRLYWRGTPEFAAARATGRLDRLPPLTPATDEAVAECEALLGRALPSLLRRCYLGFGNGGFGPGYGLLGLRGGHAPYGETAVDLFQHQCHWPAPWRPMATTLLPVCDWGRGVVSLVDCASPTAAMWLIGIDTSPGSQETFGLSLRQQHLGFAAWLLWWAEGTLSAAGR